MSDEVANDAIPLELPWSRFVAIGDSFTEGLGDPDPESPGGLRGWADRFAEVLAEHDPEFAYANLAVRGKLIGQITDEQLDIALDLRPDLVSVCAGGNDVIRPGTDPDAVAEQLESIVSRLRDTGATVILFTGVDTRFQPVFRSIRGKVAIFNENVRKVAQRNDCFVVDQWALEQLQDSRYWAGDRLHLNALGHHTIARAALDALNVPNDLAPLDPPPLPVRTWREARKEDVVWAREHLVPWVIRRIKHVSSGDHIEPKRPQPGAVHPPRHDAGLA
ncbi:SGNH hydrolase [Leucobacter sp. OLJS4]|uniref:SGNH/GDSL hydrolase family protein n=1 Tax=unclassified Leucobacter TaxID=2621730 RepID=UPI000C18D06F|nr:MULTISPECIES: SGNH/GDSL hydrolase family protein [unclassified Leucobacter]PII81375.1 SGNH hydrolase [Leucobacter sp. OLCALW19]PII86043.1 SGNH hydrolase [Leucobacter sp. OLTLW20]PII89939.1 SGNH hydrolase [Leucobacter sp. OLAS13]PII96970.1 SGNH hydrolase [Leucobacter sp. OLDS2]PIJ02334.1 SGNH hydrolase [Leucobacter sp. OLIS6]